MKLNRSLVAALLLSASTAFAYEDVTDNTGATDPPRGQGDDSFVEGVRPPGQERRQSDDVADVNSDPSATERKSGMQTAEQGELFKRLDQDQDGNVSKYEAKNYNELVQSFEEVDKDDDGVLSADELQNWEGYERIEESR